MRNLVRPSLLALLFSTFVLVAACSSSSSGTSSGGSSSSSGSSGDPTDDGGTTSSSSGNPPPSSGADVTITTEKMVVMGTQRAYVLAVPVDYSPSKKYPLVISLHGDGGTGASMQKYFSFDAVTKRDAIVAYPSGQNQTWDRSVPEDANADIQFVKGLVDELAGKYNIDKTRVLGTGYSSGGFMIDRLACSYGKSLFRAIAPNAGGMVDSRTTACPGGPVPAFVFHGDADQGVDWSSGSYLAYYWATVMDGCQDPGTAGGAENGAPTTATTPAPCKKYDGCQKEPVTWCLFPGVNHVVAPDANSIAWTYFKALP